MAKQETLGQLIRRRMDDLRIYSVAELARRLDKSRSYVTHLANDTSPTKRGKYVPEPDVLRLLASILAVPESDVLRAVDYLSPASNKNPADDIRQAGFAFFGGGRDLSKDDWEEILAMTRTLIAEKERRKKKKK